jgi:hypothetical protein
LEVLELLLEQDQYLELLDMELLILLELLDLHELLVLL